MDEQAGRPQAARTRDPRLVVLVTAGRSGSTLLRHCLDAHPDIGCPGEGNLPALLGSLGAAWHTVLSDATGDGEITNVPPRARKSMRRALLDIMRCYCVPAGKNIYVDKSLASAPWLGAVHDVFPEAQFIFLYRHPLDVVISGIEASPWGFEAFGYAAFVRQSPDNFVAALLQQWNSQVWPTLSWAERHPETCLQIRYEDLVGDPERTLERICTYLGVPNDVRLAQRAFANAPTSFTPGDRKVAFTDAVHQNSVGRGKRVPLRLIPDQLLRETNGALKEIGYQPIRRSRPGVRRASAPNSNARTAPAVDVARLRDAMPHEIELGSDSPAMRSFAVAVDDVPGLRWWFDLQRGKVSRARRRADFEIQGDCEDLIALVTGSENPAVLLQAGRIRADLPAGRGASTGAGTWALLRSAVAVLRAPPLGESLEGV